MSKRAERTQKSQSVCENRNEEQKKQYQNIMNKADVSYIIIMSQSLDYFSCKRREKLNLL